MPQRRKVAKRSVRDDRRPPVGEVEVLLDVELADGSLWLILANPSNQAAFDVSVEFRDPLIGVGGERNLADMRVFRRLPLLRPGREIRVFLDVAGRLYARRQPTEIEARVSWHSREGAAFSHTFKHDLAVWEDFGEVR